MFNINRLASVENVIKEDAMLPNPLLSILLLDYGCKTIMQTCKYQSQGVSRNGWQMSFMNAAIFTQLPRLNPTDGASWRYFLEHHVSMDTTQDVS